MDNCMSNLQIGKDEFLYFGYGSNLLASRIHFKHPSAVRAGIGILKDYRLDFSLYTNRWKGAVATVRPSKGDVVWGAIWNLSLKDLPSLDEQEGINRGLYVRKKFKVKTEDNNVVKCVLYVIKNLDDMYDLTELPPEKRPSLAYLNTIIDGAKESCLPSWYINMLKKISHNGYDGTIDLNDLT